MCVFVGGSVEPPKRTGNHTQRREYAVGRQNDVFVTESVSVRSSPQTPRTSGRICDTFYMTEQC